VSFLLDTNVIFESAKSRPNAGVMGWLASTAEEQLFLSIVSLAELRHGIERLDNGRRKAALDAWLREELPARFGARLKLADADTADQWGRMVARTQSLGRLIEPMDAWIAAIALQHNLTLVTRNTEDFETTEVRLFNPWE
jgi:predicted nucleic acid-binding protein